MESIPPLRRAYYRYLGRAYALMHAINRRSILGIRFITLVRWLPIFILLYGWLRRWPAEVLVVLALFIIWLNYSLWRAGRDNFNRFVSDGSTLMDATALEPLPQNQKIPIEASGLFSVSGRENNLLFRPADYWRVPLGEHVVMVEEKPGKYLYQFFSANSLQDIRSGWLLYGSRPVETLAVTFLARWGPEYTKFGQVYEDGDDSGLPPPKRITIYLSTADAAIRQAIWHSIVSDARRARLDNTSIEARSIA